MRGRTRKEISISENIEIDLHRLQNARQRQGALSEDTTRRLFIAFAVNAWDLARSDEEYLLTLENYNQKFTDPLPKGEVKEMAAFIDKQYPKEHWSLNDINAFLEITEQEAELLTILKVTTRKVKFVDGFVASLYLGLDTEKMRILEQLGYLKNYGGDFLKLKNVCLIDEDLKAFRQEHGKRSISAIIRAYLKKCKKIDYIKDRDLWMDIKGNIIDRDTLTFLNRASKTIIYTRIGGKLCTLNIARILARLYCDNVKNKPFLYFIDGFETNIEPKNMIFVTSEEKKTLDKLKKKDPEKYMDYIGYIQLVNSDCLPETREDYRNEIIEDILN